MDGDDCILRFDDFLENKYELELSLMVIIEIIGASS